MTTGGVKVEILGGEELRRKLQRLGDESVIALAAALYDEAWAIMEQSQIEVPVRTGVLKASGAVSQPRLTKTRAHIDLGYGGAASAYALVQHERTDYHHPALTNPGGYAGKAHYLSDPVQDRLPEMPANIERALRVLINLLGKSQ